MVSNLVELLDSTASAFPKTTAIIFGQKKITNANLVHLCNKIASGLIAVGIKKQDAVAILLDNCPEFIISYYAILKSGATVVTINHMFKTEEVKFILEDSRATMLITAVAFLDMAEELILRLDNLKFVVTTNKIKEGIIDLYSLAKDSTSVLEKIKITPLDPAVILYTSGTTGHPKGAILTHSNLVSNALDCRQAIKATHKDTFICILPLFHSFAATVCMNLPLLVGAKIVVMKSTRSFKRIIRAIRRNRVTIFAGIPSFFDILKDIRIPKIFNTPLIKLFNPLRLCISGAAALSAKTLVEFEKKFRVPLLEGYGLTEASPVVTLNPITGTRKPGSVGLPLSKNIKLKIVDNNDRALGIGEIGELLVSGPNVMKGYLNQEEATRETIKDGWLYTGDLAKFDSQGYIYIVGRKKDMINVRGLNVYPREIEEVLYQHPKVKEAAIIGIPDPHKGEVPKGFVILKDGCQITERELIQFLRERLASFKIPKYIEFRPFLPKNTTGKILKRVLREEGAIKEVLI